MPLLLIPLGLALLVALWLVLLPVGLWQRYRRGRASRLARPWTARIAAGAWAMSVALLLVGAAVAGAWIERAFVHAAAGMVAGVALGWIGWRIARVRPAPQGLWHTPSAPLVLALTLLLAARIGLGLWQFAQLGVHGAADWVAHQAGMLAVGGLLLGHQFGYAWALQRALAPRRG